MEADHDGLQLTRNHFIESLYFPMVAITAIWAVHIYQDFSGFDPGEYGIMSRRFWGIRGIVTAPLVHGSWSHLISNTIPLGVLTFLCFYFYQKVALRAFWFIYFVTGISVWFFARPVSHIGASGIVYGLVSFIFWNGIFRRSLRSIILAALVVLLYSGMFMGILPDQEGISWESHLLGSVVGIFASYIFKSELELEEAQETRNAFADEEGMEKVPFLPADVFEKTKQQRIQEALEAEQRRAAQQWNQFQPPFWTQDSTGLF